jgi:hypothetical protein
MKNKVGLEGGGGAGWAEGGAHRGKGDANQPIIFVCIVKNGLVYCFPTREFCIVHMLLDHMRYMNCNK